MTVAELPLVRSSERGAFKQCPQKWYWSYIEKLVPSSVVVGAREFGTGIHLAMAEYYVPEPIVVGVPSIDSRRGRPMLETWEEWCTETRNWGTRNDKARKQFNEEEFDEMVVMGRYLLEEHMRVYGGDPDWQVIAREETFAANIRNKAIAVGTIDLVVRQLSTGHVWIVDHKTAKSFPGETSYNMDDQGGSYSSLATTILRHKGLIGSSERVRGIIFNVLRKGKRDDRPRNEEGLYLNKNGSVSKIQPQSVLKRYDVHKTRSQQKHQLQRIVDDVEVMNAVRQGVIPVTKSPQKLCGWCDFFQLCQLDEDMGDTDSLKKALFVTRDPYHDHREGASNSKLTVEADKGLKHKERASGGST